MPLDIMMSRKRSEAMMEIREKLEAEIDWTFVENEGQESLRFDCGSQSVWFRINGNTIEVENLERCSRRLRNALERLLPTLGFIPNGGTWATLVQGDN